MRKILVRRGLRTTENIIHYNIAPFGRIYREFQTFVFARYSPKCDESSIKWQAKNNAHARDRGDEGSYTKARVSYGRGEGGAQDGTGDRGKANRLTGPAI